VSCDLDSSIDRSLLPFFLKQGYKQINAIFMVFVNSTFIVVFNQWKLLKTFKNDQFNIINPSVFKYILFYLSWEDEDARFDQKSRSKISFYVGKIKNI